MEDRDAAGEEEDPAGPPLDFGDDEVGEQLRSCSDETLDNAAFGIVRVDDDGIVEFYNDYESNLSGVDPEAALGQNFFTQLAPCSNNRIFLGRFKQGVRTDELDERFTYTFTYKMRPTLVDIRLYRDAAGHNWVLVQKR
jgi:photoactive yellow protein